MSSTIKNSDENLLHGIRERNNDVLTYIIKKNSRIISKLVLSNSGSNEDADDVLQEAIIVLFRKVKEPDFKLTSSIHTFIYSIARLIWLKELERRSGKQSINESQNNIVDEHSFESVIEKNERLKLYREKFEELGEDCKKVLRLFNLGTSMSQIAVFMGYQSEVYAKKKKYSCKEALVKSIKDTKRFYELGNE